MAASPASLRADQTPTLANLVAAAQAGDARLAKSIFDKVERDSGWKAADILAAQALREIAPNAVLSELEALAPLCRNLAHEETFRFASSLLDVVAASAKPGALECARFLLPRAEWGRDSAPCRALFCAAGSGDEELVRFLLLHRDPLARDPYGHTAFLQAVQRKREGAARILAPVSDARAISPAGHDALMTAARGGDAKLVSFLLSLGALDPTAAGPDGETAVMIAACHRRLEAVAVLAPVSDLRQRDACQSTAFDIAVGAVFLSGADLLWTEQDRDRLRALLDERGPEKMPRAKAFLEAREIGLALSRPGQPAPGASPRSPGSSFGIQDPAVPAARKRARARAL